MLLMSAIAEDVTSIAEKVEDANQIREIPGKRLDGPERSEIDYSSSGKKNALRLSCSKRSDRESLDEVDQLKLVMTSKIRGIVFF